MKKGNSPLVSGIILSAVLVYLTVYFSINGFWNAATIIVVILIALLAFGQYYLYFKFFRNEKKSLLKRTKNK